MSIRLKILLALLIAVSVVQAAFINYLLATIGVYRERQELMGERVELTRQTLMAEQELASIRARLCVAYKIALANTLDRLGLERPNSAAMQLLEAFDVRRGMPRVWSVDGLSPGGKANMGGPKPE